MPETIMIQTNKAIAGAPPPGEPAEVEANFARMLIERGHAEDMTELVNRVDLSEAERFSLMSEDDLRVELEIRGLDTSGSKVKMVRRLLETPPLVTEAAVTKVEKKVDTKVAGGFANGGGAPAHTKPVSKP